MFQLFGVCCLGYLSGLYRVVQGSVYRVCLMLLKGLIYFFVLTVFLFGF